jgi:hypothetical protein
VRVWYNIISQGAGALSPAELNGTGGQTGIPELAGKGPTGLPVVAGSDGSRLVFNAVRAFSSVIIAIDSARVKDLSLHQLADYAAMVGLMEVRAHTDVDATAPTILGLFVASGSTAPAGLSAWDTAFLKALYNTDHRSKVQREDIFLRVFHDLAP